MQRIPGAQMATKGKMVKFVIWEECFYSRRKLLFQPELANYCRQIVEQKRAFGSHEMHRVKADHSTLPTKECFMNNLKLEPSIVVKPVNAESVQALGSVPSGAIANNNNNNNNSAVATAVPIEQVAQWIQNLKCKATQDSALLELSKKREIIPDLAVFLWHTPGTVAALLMEIVDVYPCICPPVLTALQSNRVCNAMALMQCMASHSQTRSQFLEAKIPIYLYPFLLTTSTARPFEYLRLTSLGVIGALVKTDEHDVIAFLLNTEIIPLCLKIMETGSELSKTVATFILQKVLLDDTGLSYICQTYERFSQVAIVLGKMILSLAQAPSVRLLKHVIRCYYRLTDNERAKEALRQCLPEQLKDGTLASCLREDKSSQHWLRQLLRNLNGDSC